MASVEMPALLKISGDIYRSADGRKTIIVRYFQQDGKMFVGLVFSDSTEIILEQVPGSAFANDEVKWEAKGNDAALLQAGNITKYSLEEKKSRYYPGNFLRL